MFLLTYPYLAEVSKGKQKQHFNRMDFFTAQYSNWQEIGNLTPNVGYAGGGGNTNPAYSFRRIA